MHLVRDKRHCTMESVAFMIIIMMMKLRSIIELSNCVNVLCADGGDLSARSAEGQTPRDLHPRLAQLIADPGTVPRIEIRFLQPPCVHCHCRARGKPQRRLSRSLWFNTPPSFPDLQEHLDSAQNFFEHRQHLLSRCIRIVLVPQHESGLELNEFNALGLRECHWIDDCR